MADKRHREASRSTVHHDGGTPPHCHRRSRSRYGHERRKHSRSRSGSRVSSTSLRRSQRHRQERRRNRRRVSGTRHRDEYDDRRHKRRRRRTKLEFMDGNFPEKTSDLVIANAGSITFGPGSLHGLQDLRYLRILGTNNVQLKKLMAVDLNVISVLLEIEDCGQVNIEKNTFSTIRGPLSVVISNCDSVTLQGNAFSWVLNMNITNIRTLRLDSGAFTLDPTAPNVGEHGPGMTIDITNATVPELPLQTFGSSAAQINLSGLEIYVVKPDFFSANTYNIVLTTNCTFHQIDKEAYSKKSLFNYLQFYECRILLISTNALVSGISNFHIAHTTFDYIEPGAINTSVATVIIVDSTFKIFKEKRFEFVSWNRLKKERNIFDEIPSYAIVAPTTSSAHELVFMENEIETINPHSYSLDFVGEAIPKLKDYVVYKSNYYGQPCKCDFASGLIPSLGGVSETEIMKPSFCTVDKLIARCFNVPQQNIVFLKFYNGLCTEKNEIQCEPFKAKIGGTATEIKNPRFPHKKESSGLSDRNKKVIGIVIVTCIGCVLLALLISLIRWLRRRGYCAKFKNLLISSNSSCSIICDRLCRCGSDNGVDNTRSMSQFSVHEYSERHLLNEPRTLEVAQETTLPQMYNEEHPMEDKVTQTLPEELSRELLENLKEKLDDPEKYVEAREMIEHLYDLVKIEQANSMNQGTLTKLEENIYDLPFQHTAPRIGINNKQMISIGTRTPSLDRLQPLSPYSRQTALAHEYFEPKDFVIHLYAEIANSDKDRKALLRVMPDVVGDQNLPRGPYLCAVREKNITGNGGSSTQKSSKSISSNSSMANRPLPEKPVSLDAGEGTSNTRG